MVGVWVIVAVGVSEGVAVTVGVRVTVVVGSLVGVRVKVGVEVDVPVIVTVTVDEVIAVPSSSTEAEALQARDRMDSKQMNTSKCFKGTPRQTRTVAFGSGGQRSIH